MLGFIIYEVDFPDVQVKDYVADAIADKTISQVDDKGYRFTLVDSIVDHKIDY